MKEWTMMQRWSGHDQKCSFSAANALRLAAPNGQSPDTNHYLHHVRVLITRWVLKEHQVRTVNHDSA